MEPDRYQESHLYYLTGLICLIISLSLFAFSAYILPYLMFAWHYTLPDFIFNWVSVIQTDYDMSLTAASWIVLLIFFVPAILFAIIADIASNRIDNKIHGIDERKNTTKSGDNESKSLILRIVFIIILVFIASQLFQWAISTQPA